MRPALPPLAAIRAFEAAARHLNFTDAGEELGMTQAAVSYQIRVLEERVGLPLFHRQARGVSLTEAGARLAQRSGEALDLLREAFAEARGQSGERLVISSLATFATRILGPRLGRFQIAHPQISTRVDISHRFVDFTSGEATVAIRVGTGPFPGLGADLLLRSEFTPMVSAAFAAKHGPFTTPADLLGVPRVDPADPGWALWFRAAGVVPPSSADRNEFGTQILQAEAALAGQGAAILSPIYFHDAIARGELVRPFRLLVAEELSVWLVYPARRRDTPAVRAFRDWLLGEMAELHARAGDTA